ncbi:MAG: energy-coupling factor transporter ATPase [Clostridia bacterium]|nr:energy-coupling factor transporter ATPase [Clostridia bacterium]
MSILNVENLSYTYGEGTPFEKKALDNISFSIEQGEIIGVIGHTGSGKSTLLQHLNGLLRPQSGKVIFNGTDIWEKPKEIRNIRFKIGICFQYPEHQLFEDTVFKDVSFGPTNMGLDDTEIKKRTRLAIDSVGLGMDFWAKSPFDLSGGEKRRVAIAGVIAMDPDILILDEPTAGLDPRGRDEILALLKSYRKDHNKTIIIASHSMEDVASFADRVMVFNKSKLVMFDTVKNVFSQSEQLTQIGLDIPQVTQLFIGLKEKGYNVSESVFTVEDAVKALISLKEGGISNA